MRLKRIMLMQIFLIFAWASVTHAYVTCSFDLYANCNDDLAGQVVSAANGTYNLYSPASEEYSEKDAFACNSRSYTYRYGTDRPVHPDSLVLYCGSIAGGGQNGLYTRSGYASAILTLTSNTVEEIQLSFDYYLHTRSTYGVGVTGSAGISVLSGEDSYLNGSISSTRVGSDVEDIFEGFFNQKITLTPGEPLVLKIWADSVLWRDEFICYGGGDGLIDNLEIGVTAVPLPPSFWLLGAGLSMLWGLRKRL